MVERRIKAARFPATKSLDTFDFLAMPSVNKHLVMQLARCAFTDEQVRWRGCCCGGGGRAAAAGLLLLRRGGGALEVESQEVV